MPNLQTMLLRFSEQIPPIIMLLQSVTALMGLYFIASALMEFWGVDNPNASKFVSGGDRFSVGGGIVQLLIGGILTAMSTLQLVGILSRTLTDDYANSRFLSYTPAGGSFDEQRIAALATILGIMQIVGFTAMVKGWMVINGVAHGKEKGGYGSAFVWLIGGVVAWNFKWFTDVLNCTFGFNVIGMFVPYGMQNACH